MHFLKVRGSKSSRHSLVKFIEYKPSCQRTFANRNWPNNHSFDFLYHSIDFWYYKQYYANLIMIINEEMLISEEYIHCL